MQRVIPALLPSSASALRSDLASLSFVHEVQVDVVDGVYVPPVSWPYQPSGDPKEVTDALQPYSFEVDLMVADQVKAAQAWAAQGAQTIIFHVPGVDVSTVVAFADAHPAVSVAVAATATTPVAEIVAFLPYIDMVQLMGIASIGAQGQPFDERTLERIAQLRAKSPEVLISIDGSMNEETIPRARAAGADRFAVGSALLTAPDRLEQYQKLERLAT